MGKSPNRKQASHRGIGRGTRSEPRCWFAHRPGVTTCPRGIQGRAQL